MSQNGRIHLDTGPEKPIVIQFVELFNKHTRRVHVGCVMDVGHNWGDVSLPLNFRLPERLWIKYYPHAALHSVKEVSRKNYCVRLEYIEMGPELQNLSVVGVRRHASDM